MKERSDFLRHPLMEELVNENTYINEVSWPLIAPELPHHPNPRRVMSSSPPPAASCLKQLASLRAAGLCRCA